MTRTEIMLEAAKQALEHSCYSYLDSHNECKFSDKMSDNPFGINIDSSEDPAELRCLYLCFAAAMAETGDL